VLGEPDWGCEWRGGSLEQAVRDSGIRPAGNDGEAPRKRLLARLARSTRYRG
jgi:hypothetical protein